MNFDLLYGPRRDGPNENGDLFPPDVRQQLISEYLGSAQGRSRLAASIANPLRQYRDYQSIARRTFLVEQMPEGALPVYDRDPEPGVMMTLRAGDPRFDPPDFVLPEWVQAGAFARLSGSDVPTGFLPETLIEVSEVMRPQDPPGRNGPTYVKVQIWRAPFPEDVHVLRADAFSCLWEPCERPADPSPYWERLLEDDPF